MNRLLLRTTQRAGFAVGLAILIRLLVDIYLWKTGYFYGDDPDSFWRVGLSWRWSQHPFFLFGHWVPFQFWLDGVTFGLLRPFYSASSLLVPVIWNHLFLAGSLVLLYLATWELAGRAAAGIAVVIASTMTTDVWTTYSGLAEPLIVLCGMVIAFSFYKCLESSSKEQTPYIYSMSAAATLASATHYVGWYFVIFVLGFLAYQGISWVAIPSRRSSRHFFYLALAFLLVLAFPLSWMLANQVEFGNPLRFLTQAQAYHQWFAQRDIISRLTSIARAMWNSEPIILLASLPALPFIALRRPRALLYLAPGIVYLAGLSVSSVLSYAVPETHYRYTLYPAWVLIPVIAAIVAAALASRRPIMTMMGTAILAIIVVAGLLRSLHFENWMDDEARQVARALDRQMLASGRPTRVLVDHQPCLYPTAGIANSVSRPDWTTLAGADEMALLQDGFSEPSPAFDLALLANPLAIRALAADTVLIEAIGDYAIVGASTSPQPTEEPTPLPIPWTAIRQDEFLYVNPNGTVFFSFESAPDIVGDRAGIEALLPTSGNSCYILSADLQDWYERAEPSWTILQQLVANGVVLWSHDVAGTGGCWQRLDHYIMSTSDQLRIQLRVVALAEPIAPIDWSRVALTGVRGLRLSPCP